MEYAIDRPLIGKPTVHYRCPSCQVDLISPLAEAGNDDRCPHCQHAFLVPGVDEKSKDELAAKAKAQKAEEEKKLADETRKREREALRRQEIQRAQKKERDIEIALNQWKGVFESAGWVKLLGFCLFAVGIAVWLVASIHMLIMAAGIIAGSSPRMTQKNYEALGLVTIAFLGWTMVCLCVVGIGKLLTLVAETSLMARTHVMETRELRHSRAGQPDPKSP